MKATRRQGLIDFAFSYYRVSHNLVNRNFSFHSRFSTESLLICETSDKTHIIFFCKDSKLLSYTLPCFHPTVLSHWREAGRMGLSCEEHPTGMIWQRKTQGLRRISAMRVSPNAEGRSNYTTEIVSAKKGDS
jgi:hypothetical protein